MSLQEIIVCIITAHRKCLRHLLAIYYPMQDHIQWRLAC